MKHKLSRYSLDLKVANSIHRPLVKQACPHCKELIEVRIELIETLELTKCPDCRKPIVKKGLITINPTLDLKLLKVGK